MGSDFVYLSFPTPTIDMFIIYIVYGIEGVTCVA